MAEFSMTCSCGHEMKVEAGSRDEAVGKLQAMMTQEAIDQHLAEYHKNDAQKPTLDMVHASISQALAAV